MSSGEPKLPEDTGPGAPDALPDGPWQGITGFEGRGSFDGQWLIEEDREAHRFGLRADSCLHREQSPYQEIAAYETRSHGRALTLDGLLMVTERDEFVYHEMLVHVPLCVHPSPRQVLVVGGGDAGCAREILRHPGIERVVQCDIDERVTAVSRRTFDWVEPTLADPRVETVFTDGVRFVAEHPGAFDLVIIDSTDPFGPAVGLFQRDFYHSVAAALRPGGLVTAQTESPHWAAETVGRIYQELRAAFSCVRPYLGWMPTYPSGCWSWALAARHEPPQVPDPARTRMLAPHCRYYNPEIHQAAFVLPEFARLAVAGENTFARLDAVARARHSQSNR